MTIWTVLTYFSEVPQGSHLGPVLLGVIINDVKKVSKYSKIFKVVFFNHGYIIDRADKPA